MQGVLRGLVVGLTAFLTVADLFAAQAILPALTSAYGVTPATMGFAVNACTIGMAAGGLGVALFGRTLERRRGILISLAILAVPTALLATMPPLPILAMLRIAQGLCMSTAFALTLAYLSETVDPGDIGSAFAAYVTGNVASNLFGRLVATGVADHYGLSASFLAFAILNLLGVALVWFTVKRSPRLNIVGRTPGSALAKCLDDLSNPALVAAFAIGFTILFAFVGTFSYVNFVLVKPPFSVGMMALGVVYLVFLPSIATTPFAGRVVRGFGTRRTLWLSFAVASVGLPLLLCSSFAALLGGLALIAVGTFFAQATVTSFVNHAATGDHGSASGLYLASYFLGGLAGAAILGQVFDRLGWAACVAGIGLAFVAGAVLAAALTTRREHEQSDRPLPSGYTEA